MEQVKIFGSHDVPNPPVRIMEDDINAWLTKNEGKVEIVRVVQSSAGLGFLATIITIFYTLNETKPVKGPS